MSEKLLASRLIGFVASEVRTVSPITTADVVRQLIEHADQNGWWIKATAETIPEFFQSLHAAADRIEAHEKHKYNLGVVEARLPDRFSGVIYIRGWRRIREFDSTRARLPVWLRGFVPLISHEERRRPRGLSLNEGDHIIEIRDPIAVDPVEAAMANEEFEAIFDEIRYEHLTGIDWAEQTRENLLLIDVWREALRSRWLTRNPKQRAILTEVLCDGTDRETVARKYGFGGRSSVDQLLKRFRDAVRQLALRLQAAVAGIQ